MGCGVILAVANSREQLKEEAPGRTAKKVQRKIVGSNKTPGVDIDRKAQSYRSPAEFEENRTPVEGGDKDGVIELVESKPEEKLCEGAPIEIGDSDGKIKDDKSKPVIKERNPLPLKQKIDESKVGPSVKTKMEIEKEVKVQTRVGIAKQNEVSKIDAKNKGVQIKKESRAPASEVKKNEQKQKKTGSIKQSLQKGRNSDDSKNVSIKKDEVQAVKVQNGKKVDPKQGSKIVEPKTDKKQVKKQVKKEQPQLQKNQKGRGVKVQKGEQKQTKNKSSPREQLLQSTLKNDKPQEKKQSKKPAPRKQQQQKQGKSDPPLHPKQEKVTKDKTKQEVKAEKKEEAKSKQGLKEEDQKMKTIGLSKQVKTVDGKSKPREAEKKSKIVNQSPLGQIEEPLKKIEGSTIQHKKISENTKPVNETPTSEPQIEEGVIAIENVPQIKATQIKQTCRINTAEKSSNQSKRSQRKQKLNDIHTHHPTQLLQKISQSSINSLKPEKEPNRQMIPVDSLFLNAELMDEKTEERESKTQIQNQPKTQITSRPGSRQQFKNGGAKSKQLMSIKQNRDEPPTDLLQNSNQPESVIVKDTSMSNIVPDGSRHSKKQSTNKSLVSKRQVRAIQLQKSMKRLKEGMKKAKEEQSKKILVESNHLKKIYNL